MTSSPSTKLSSSCLLLSFFVASAAADIVSVDKTCYNLGQIVQINFENEAPLQDDWFGIYSADADINALPSPSNWIWTCGSRDCRLSAGVRKGGVFYSDVLPTGSWKVVLARNGADEAPYVGLASSQVFEVSQNCAVPVAQPTASPVMAQPTASPVMQANPAPTVKATPSPAVAPVQNPVSNSAVTFTLDTEAALLAARADIRKLIRGRGGDRALAAKFLRLGFHDCVGGCDGCVDLSNPENGGLLVPIEALRPVVEMYANADTGLSRADIWALATATGAAVVQGPVKVSFAMTDIGRVDCENANTVCQNEHGEVQDCSDIRGPHRIIPGANTNSRELFEFFFNEFGFDTKEGVALMGAHTIGELKRENTGIEGHGWLRNNHILDNEYYRELIGGSSRTDSFDTFINDAPNWKLTVERTDANGVPDLHVWTGRPGGVKIVMLNADIAMARDLDSTNMDENGKVSCNFRRQGACPVNQRVIDFLIDYRFDNQMWLDDFSDVLLRMLRNKYTETTNCVGSICLLQPN